MEITYHKDVFMPSHALNAYRPFFLRYGTHAKNQCDADRYGKISPVYKVTVNQENLVELTLDGLRITKLLVRVPHDGKHDVCIVFLVDGFVKTCWLCMKSDTHKTLKRHLYPTR